ANTGANNVTLSYNGPLVLGAGNIASGSLNITNTGNITQAANTTFNVGGTAAFTASGGVLTLGNANAFTGAVSLSNTGSNAVTLNDTRALVLGTGNVAAGNLVVTATGNITQAANTTLAVGGSAAFTATNGAISLSQTGNGNVALGNARALLLDNVAVPTGTLTLTATGNISQVTIATITAGSTAGFNATNGAITLDQANTFSGAVDLSNTGANNVTLSYNGPLVLGAGNIASGNLNVTNTGNITQAANTTLAVGGTASFNTSNGVITLNQANAFTGAVALTNAGAFDVTLDNGKALVLGTSNVATGNLVVSATGTITQAANTTLAVGWTASFNATNGAITLNQANAFSGAVALNNAGAFDV